MLLFLREVTSSLPHGRRAPKPQMRLKHTPRSPRPWLQTPSSPTVPKLHGACSSEMVRSRSLPPNPQNQPLGVESEHLYYCKQPPTRP